MSTSDAEAFSLLAGAASGAPAGSGSGNVASPRAPLAAPRRQSLYAWRYLATSSRTVGAAPEEAWGQRGLAGALETQVGSSDRTVLQRLVACEPLLLEGSCARVLKPVRHRQIERGEPRGPVY